MRFEFYTEKLENVPKLSVDGTVENSIHFSHWEGNRTPAEVKADTSTEIALNLVTSPNRDALTQGIELVTNNHFDTDGVLSVWTVMTGERAAEYRDVLIAAAEAGDFSEYSTAAGIRISLAIQGSDQASPNESGSPLVRLLAGEEVDDEDYARAYELVLPEVESLVRRINDYEPLWRAGWEQIETACASFERGVSHVTEFTDFRMSLITLAPEIFNGGTFNPTRHAAPYTAISRFARGQLYLIAIPAAGGWFYRIDYPYYSWAETMVRPHIERRDFGNALQRLNEREGSGAGQWRLDNREMTSIAKFLGHDGSLAPSHQQPDEVARIIETESMRLVGVGA
jgi:Family of unknown function (DUF6687)